MSAPKQVSQYTLEGKFVKTYPSQSHAAKALGVSINHIRLAANGYNKTAGGFVWRLVEAEALGVETLPQKEHSGVGVSKYTLEGDFVQAFCSATSAAREIGGDATKILAAARTKKKAVYGFLWRCYKVARLSPEDVALTDPRTLQR